MKNYQIILSENILSKAKIGEDTTSLRKELYYIRPSSLEIKLNTDELKKAFWVNIYKAYILIMANEPQQKSSMLKRKRIKIAHNLLSLDDIEHGILRIHKYKIGFCYVNNPFYPSFIKRLSIEKIDYGLSLEQSKSVLANSKNKINGTQYHFNK
jgi:Protein of unknown function, DUF547